MQSFHEQVRSRRSRYRPILKDVVAFANTNGGTIYVGVSASPTQPVVGVPTPEESARGLRDALARSVVPKLDVTVDIEASGGKPILIVTIPKGLNTPYATDAGQVFVRQESETVIALRDEIVQLVREAAAIETPSPSSTSRASAPGPRRARRRMRTTKPTSPGSRGRGGTGRRSRSAAPSPGAPPASPPFVCAQARRRGADAANGSRRNPRPYPSRPRRQPPTRSMISNRLPRQSQKRRRLRMIGQL